MHIIQLLNADFHDRNDYQDWGKVGLRQIFTLFRITLSMHADHSKDVYYRVFGIFMVVLSQMQRTALNFFMVAVHNTCLTQVYRGRYRQTR